MKQDTVYKRSFNATLDALAGHVQGEPLPSENGWAAQLGVSRTTVRKIKRALLDRGVLTGAGAAHRLARTVAEADYFPAVAIVPTSDRVERLFMEWMLRGDRKPGDFINGLDLARQFGVSAGAVREYLNRFSRFGLIERRPNSRWLFRGFTPAFALELFQVRELFEIAAARAFASLPPDAPEWRALKAIAREHEVLLAKIEARYHDFSELDNRFHRLISGASRNRFFVDFHDVIAMIFHYHYQWNKTDERERNEVAAREHLACIACFLDRDVEGVEQACRRHLASARETLLLSIA